MTGDYAGTSKAPMVWQDRVYFLSDRDGTMNLWSMALDGDRRQTAHAARRLRRAVAVARPAAGSPTSTAPTSASTTSPPAPTGPVPITSGLGLRPDARALGHGAARLDHVGASLARRRPRGPHGARPGLRRAGSPGPARRGDAQQAGALSRRPLHARRQVAVGLSDETGEVEFWTPAGQRRRRRRRSSPPAATVLRWDGVPSPDGASIAHHDKDQQLWVFDVTAKTANEDRRQPCEGGFDDLAWSPDSRWLAYTAPDANTLTRIHLWDVDDRQPRRSSRPTATTATARRGARRQVAVLPVRSQLRVAGAQPVGIARSPSRSSTSRRRSTTSR